MGKVLKIIYYNMFLGSMYPHIIFFCTFLLLLISLKSPYHGFLTTSQATTKRNSLLNDTILSETFLSDRVR